MTLRLYDTATREVRDFVPLEEGKAGIYVCGLTVQSEPHVGHVRSAVNFDVLRRWLTHQGYDVTFIRNVTDIDDKILTKAAEQGRPWFNLAYAMHRELDRSLAAINVLPPTYEPGATGHIPEMVELITTLIAKGHAYPAEDGSGDVYFDVRSWPAYGELTNQGLDDMAPGRGRRPARASATRATSRSGRAGRRSPSPRPPRGRRRGGRAVPAGTSSARRWRASTSARPSTSTAAGSTCASPTTRTSRRSRARPATRSRRTGCTTPGSPPAGEKMSKSLGNSLLIPSVLERVRGIELRFYIVAAHYRSHVEFSFEALDEAAAGFRRIENFLDRAAALGIGHDERPTSTSRLGAPAEVSLPETFVAAMDDDLGTPAAVAVLYDTVRDGNKLLADGPSAALITAVRQVVGDARRARARPA